MLLKAEISIFVAEGRSIRDGDNAILQVSLNNIIIEGDKQISIQVLVGKFRFCGVSFL